MKSRQAGQIRIIGGEWRGRRLKVADRPGLRPTPDRLRETVFNWLASYLPGARCLDLFAGSGALGFEAASRGAAEVIMVETSRHVARLLHEHVAMLSATQVEIMTTSAEHYLQQQLPQPFDIVFLDPPFDAGLLTPCLSLLAQSNWLAEDAMVYIETPAGQPLPAVLNENWQLHRQQQSGHSQGNLLIVNALTPVQT